MFNVTLPWNGQSNRRLAEPQPYDDPLTLASIVRENFGQVDYYSVMCLERENAWKYTGCHTRTVSLVILSRTPSLNLIRSRRTEGITYICRGPGALLSLPCGGYREDAIHKRVFRGTHRTAVWTAGLTGQGMLVCLSIVWMTSFLSLGVHWSLRTLRPFLMTTLRVHRFLWWADILHNVEELPRFIWSNIRGTIEYHDSQLKPVCLSRLHYVPCIDFSYLRWWFHPHLAVLCFHKGVPSQACLFWTDYFELLRDPVLTTLTTLTIMERKIYKWTVPCAPKLGNLLVRWWKKHDILV